MTRIRPEREADVRAITRLVKTAFETAAVSDGDEHAFVARLRGGDGYVPDLALVAEEDGDLVGHVMLTRIAVSTPAGPRPALMLAPLCVALARRRRGVGARLVEEALARARALGWAAVFLLGDRAYYARFGFRPSVEFGIGNANGFPDAHVLALALTPDGLRERAGGAVSFPA